MSGMGGASEGGTSQPSLSSEDVDTLNELIINSEFDNE
jgi:hypothetical protein